MAFRHFRGGRALARRWQATGPMRLSALDLADTLFHRLAWATVGALACLALRPGARAQGACPFAHATPLVVPPPSPSPAPTLPTALLVSSHAASRRARHARGPSPLATSTRARGPNARGCTSRRGASLTWRGSRRRRSNDSRSRRRHPRAFVWLRIGPAGSPLASDCRRATGSSPWTERRRSRRLRTRSRRSSSRAAIRRSSWEEARSSS